MLPANIRREHILKAIEYIDKNGVVKGRNSRKYHLVYNGNHYPPKYVVSLANMRANGEMYPPYEFSGGKETNDFLKKYGFEITPDYDCEGDDDSSYKFPDQHKNRNLSIVTVNIDSPLPYSEQLPPKEFFWERVELLENVIKTKPTADIILFPAGFFEAEEFEERLITEIGLMLNDYLKKVAPDTIVCYGLDFDFGRDQLAFAVSSEEILAIGRKFYPTDSEKGKISISKSYNEKEMNYNRTFYIRDTKFYLAVCYDGFGIRHRQEKNPDVNVVLDLVHGFYPKGTGLSGDVDFARKGFTGASLEWNCPVFGAAVFFERKVPPNFPTGVFWTNYGQSVKGFKYEDNEIEPTESFIVGEKSEKAYCKVYKI